jgi:hypothetical protein
MAGSFRARRSERDSAQGFDFYYRRRRPRKLPRQIANTGPATGFENRGKRRQDAGATKCRNCFAARVGSGAGSVLSSDEIRENTSWMRGSGAGQFAAQYVIFKPPVVLRLDRLARSLSAPPKRPASYFRRGVAQPGRAPGSGPGGRWFKSTRPDHSNCFPCLGSFTSCVAKRTESVTSAARETFPSGRLATTVATYKPRAIGGPCRSSIQNSSSHDPTHSRGRNFSRPGPAVLNLGGF